MRTTAFWFSAVLFAYAASEIEANNDASLANDKAVRKSLEMQPRKLRKSQKQAA